MDTEDVSLDRFEKVRELWGLLWYDPRLSITILALSLLTAVFEGVGLGFLLPIVQQISSGGTLRGSEEPLLRYLSTAYETIGIPFTLRYLVYGLAVVMVIRYTSSFLVTWLSALLRLQFVRDMKAQLFESTIDAQVAHLDDRGTDELLNAILKQTDYTGDIIRTSIMFLKASLVSLVYLAVSLYLAPVLTVLAGVLLGVTVFLIRFVIKPAYATGDRVASANEDLQRTARASIKGVRELKLFGMRDQLWSSFDRHLDQFVSADVELRRNRSLLSNGFQLVSSLVVFGLIYLSVTSSTLSLGAIAVFLFAMFRLAPKINSLNNMAYHINGILPHHTRTQKTLESLRDAQESTPGEGTQLAVAPSRIAFENVSFDYADGTAAIKDVSLSATTGEFVALVGPSGAGKSTIVSLLSRLHEPRSGTIRANGTDIQTLDLRSWRSHIAVVRQDPFLFNETLRFNLTLGRSTYSPKELDRVCDLCHVSDFLQDLPEGLDTNLGDDGVRLSGGQRQRVAIARALLQDASILVLDEATSDLDTALESKIHAAINSLDRELITVAIAHRLSTVVDADRILVVEDGRIAEQGDHRELIENDDVYAELSQTQSGL